MTQTSSLCHSDHDDDLDARDTCALVLVLCAQWLALYEPEASIDAEVKPGVWCNVNLLNAAELALAELREQNGGH